MQTIKIDLNNKSAVVDLDSYIQVQQGDSALPVQFLFVSGADTVDMSDGKIGFISGVTAGNHNIELEAPGNGAGQCVINLNSYLFQDAGAFEWLYVGVKDSNNNIITAVNATLTVKASNLDNGINTGDYRSDWQKFKDGLTDDVNQLSSSVNNIANKATETENNLNATESSANSAISQSLSAASYATTTADSAISTAQSAVDNMNKNVQTAINGMSENLNNQLAPFVGKQDACDVLKSLGKTSLDDLPVGRYACNGWNSNMKGQYPVTDWISLDVGYDCTNGSRTQFIQALGSGIYYRAQGPNGGKWTAWHHLGDDNSYVNNTNMSDTNLMNGASGVIKVQRLGNTVTINLSVTNYAKNGTVVYQLPSQYRPTAQRIVQAWEINSDHLYVDNLTINTDGTITIAQRGSDNSSVNTINMNGTFTYFV